MARGLSVSRDMVSPPSPAGCTYNAAITELTQQHPSPPDHFQWSPTIHIRYQP